MMHIERMQEEAVKLQEKRNKLLDFIGSGESKDVWSDEDRKLALNQLHYMCHYLETLKERIERELAKAEALKNAA